MIRGRAGEEPQGKMQSAPALKASIEEAPIQGRCYSYEIDDGRPKGRLFCF
ncbi:hypothetical protein PPF1_92 [Rhizobium phage vB_RleM_PPF1]|uniref:hypothetical protein n=1 Tax=Rhizobium phage vB_RleM_PPF1 TaxID=1498228 RepID=UPI00049A387B|nr:hypothetical protein PPF1_92 [Rhizobium phage vB_RleM_PPF1]AID18405.1 hypothetical protein PPF1_92 [Rhizobium phage vB_RleM_PPF1]